MQSIPFNYISYFSFQIKHCKGKTERLKLSMFDAFKGGYFLFVFLFCVFKVASCISGQTAPQCRIPSYLTILLSSSSLKRTLRCLAWMRLGWCWWRQGGCCAHRLGFLQPSSPGPCHSPLQAGTSSLEITWLLPSQMWLCRCFPGTCCMC